MGLKSMLQINRSLLFLSALLLLGSTGLSGSTGSSQTAKVSGTPVSTVKHVLLISVDGLHELDVQTYIKTHPQSTLTRLGQMGITYTAASASQPSDSFPGLLAMVTGGTPRSTGVYYDDSFDRSLSPPGSNCATMGTEVDYSEAIDVNVDAVDAGGGIDPAKLPLDPKQGCTPVYPHSYLKVNTLFEVVKAANLRTAWADKHPSYDLVNGPSGKGVDDLYTPEIEANDTTTAVNLTEAYDDLKVKAILNQIDGKDHSGTQSTGVPALFGMNFQAVSVGQKVNGYQSKEATPSKELLDALDHTDQSLGKIVDELKAKGLLEETLIVVSAKHGQSPIDPAKRRIIDKKAIAAVVEGVQPELLAQLTADDVALLWLQDPSKTATVVTALKAQQEALGIQTVFSGAALKQKFPALPNDNRTPDIILQPQSGVIYTKPDSKKQAEHGGFTEDDTHVALIVANPKLPATTNPTAVQTTQIAPTLLKALGLDPQALQAVQMEKTPILPGLF